MKTAAGEGKQRAKFWGVQRRGVQWRVQGSGFGVWGQKQKQNNKKMKSKMRKKKKNKQKK